MKNNHRWTSIESLGHFFFKKMTSSENCLLVIILSCTDPTKAGRTWLTRQSWQGMRRKSTCRWKCLFYGNNDDGDDDGDVIYGDDQVVISMMMTKSCPGEQQSSCQLHDDDVDDGSLLMMVKMLVMTMMMFKMLVMTMMMLRQITIVLPTTSTKFASFKLKTGGWPSRFR